MTPDSIDKKTESGYSYEYVSPGPIEGAEGIILPVEVPEGGKPALTRDQITSSTEVAKKFPPPPYDNPQAPIPTKKALRIMAVKREIVETMVKGSPKEGAPAALGIGKEGAPTAPEIGKEGAPAAALGIGKEGAPAPGIDGGGAPAALGIGKGGAPAPGIDGGGAPALRTERQGSENLWMKYPSRVAAVIIAIFEYMKNMSTSRFNEAQMQRNVNSKSFELGIESANLSKELKDIAASKEFLKVGQAFATIGISIFQIGAIAQSRTKTKEKVEKEGEYSKQITDQKKKIDDMTKAGYTDNLKAGEVRSQDPKEIEKIISRNPKTEKAIKKEETHLRSLEKSQREELQDASHRSTTLIDLKTKIYNSFSEGLFNIATGIYTQKEGSGEKEKAIADTLQQYLSRFNDTVSKAKDDFASQYDKSLQTIAQYSSETKATLSTRG